MPTLQGEHHFQALWVRECVGEKVHAVEADPRRFLNDWPGRFLTLVPFVGDWANHGLCKVVYPRLQRALVLIEIH